MTPLKALAFVSVFALGIVAQPAFAVNGDTASGARNEPGQTVDPAQASPRPQLTPEERKAKRKHRRMMKRQRQQERQFSAPPAQQPDRL